MISDILTEEILKQGRFWSHSKTLVSNCTKISDGCQNCWAESMSIRFHGIPFDGHVVEHWDRMIDILPKGNRPRKPRVFTYWNDCFHPGISDNFLTRLFNLIDVSIDYHIVCTKRPERSVDYFSKYPGNSAKSKLIILVTMEDQEMAEKRGSDTVKLANMGWNVGALVEPMLAPVDLEIEAGQGVGSLLIENLKWVIVGGENGKGKRPFDPQWAIALNDQCLEAGVPFYFKGNGGLLGSHRYLGLPEI